MKFFSKWLLLGIVAFSACKHSGASSIQDSGVQPRGSFTDPLSGLLINPRDPIPLLWFPYQGPAGGSPLPPNVQSLGATGSDAGSGAAGLYAGFSAVSVLRYFESIPSIDGQPPVLTDPMTGSPLVPDSQLRVTEGSTDPDSSTSLTYKNNGKQIGFWMSQIPKLFSSAFWRYACIDTSVDLSTLRNYQISIGSVTIGQQKSPTWSMGPYTHAGRFDGNNVLTALPDGTVMWGRYLNNVYSGDVLELTADGYEIDGTWRGGQRTQAVLRTPSGNVLVLTATGKGVGSIAAQTVADRSTLAADLTKFKISDAVVQSVLNYIVSELPPTALVDSTQLDQDGYAATSDADGASPTDAAGPVAATDGTEGQGTAGQGEQEQGGGSDATTEKK